MSARSSLHFLPLITYIYLMTIGNVMASFGPNLTTIKGTYYPSWTGYPPQSIDTSLFTHVFYAFLSPSNVTYEFDVPDATNTSLSGFIAALRSKNPPVKALLSIGGADEGPALFAKIASSASSREVFVKSSVNVARRFGFDGLDLDWEYPRSPQEMDDLASLLMEWRFELEREARATGRARLLLTAATYFSADFFLDKVSRTYPVTAISRSLDWVNAMCYDYHGAWDASATGALASFFDPKSNISSMRGLTSWIDAGLSKEMLVMGIPLYGRSWQLRDPNITGIGAPAISRGPGAGFLPYSEVQEFIKNHSARVIYDAETVSTYAYAGRSWVSYDSVASSMVKIGLAQALGLRGYFFWALSFEDNWEISAQASRAWIRDN